MAISWAQGLLAGASGVAEYSDQEQQKRQLRLDKTKALEDQMAMTQAKSRYAAKMNEWIENKKELKALQGLEAGGFDEQRILYMQKGYTPQEASVRAAQVIQSGGPRLTKPKRVDEPNIDFNPRMAKRAKSPLQEWIEGYKEEPSTYQPEEPKPSTNKQSLKEFTREPQGSLEPMGGQGPTELQELVDGGNLQSQTIGGQEFQPQPDYVNPLATPEKLTKTVVKGVMVDGKEGDTIVWSNPQGKEVTRQHVTTGKAAVGGLFYKESQLPDGSKIKEQMMIDPETGEPKSTGERWRTKIADEVDPKTGNKKVTAILDLPTREQYIRMPSEKAKEEGQIRGQFYTDFPDEEREKWKELDYEGGFFGYGKETPEAFEESMADAMLEVKRKQSKVIENNPALLDNPKVMRQLEDRWKALAYTRVLEPEAIIKAVKEEAFDPVTFFGPQMNKYPTIQKIQEGIMQLDMFKGKDKGKLYNQFNSSVRF